MKKNPTISELLKLIKYYNKSIKKMKKDLVNPELDPLFWEYLNILNGLNKEINDFCKNEFIHDINPLGDTSKASVLEFLRLKGDHLVKRLVEISTHDNGCLNEREDIVGAIRFITINMNEINNPSPVLDF